MTRLWRALRSRDSGMTTAEYCIGTLAACAFGAILYKLLSSNWAYDIVKGVIGQALKLLHL